MCARIFLVVFGIVLLPGCGVAYMRKAEPTERLLSPPAGKALVNFHRPTSFGGGVDFPVFDRYKLIGNTKGNTGFQYACDPGEHILQAKADKVTVVHAQLLADKIYDIVCDVGFGWIKANIKLIPLGKGEPRRAEVKEWEDSERLLVLVDDEKTRKFEDKRRADNEEILKDFLGGEKSDRVSKLNADDHR